MPVSKGFESVLTIFLADAGGAGSAAGPKARLFYMEKPTAWARLPEGGSFQCGRAFGAKAGREMDMAKVPVMTEREKQRMGKYGG